MDYSHLLSFAVVTGLLVMSPGPNGVLIAKTVPTSGRAAGFANVAGIATAFYLHGALSIFGISILLLQSAQLFFFVKMVGASYLIWLGIKSLLAAFKKENANESDSSSVGSRSVKIAYVEGFLTNALNPKVSLFYLAAFPQFMPVGDQALIGAFTLVVIHSLIAILWFSGMVFVMGKVSGAVRNPAFQRWIKGAGGVVFLGFGAKLAAFKP